RMSAAICGKSPGYRFAHPGYDRIRTEPTKLRNHDGAAVRGDRLSRHVAGVVAEQERDHRGNVLRTANAAHRNARAGRVELVVTHLDARLCGVGEPRNDAIDADAVRSPIERQRLRQREYAALAGGIMCASGSAGERAPRGGVDDGAAAQ